MSDLLHADLDQIEAAMRNLRVMGDSGIRISGSLMSGLKVDMDVAEEAVTVAAVAVVTPATGACCVGTDCTIETEAGCGDLGGIYQGDDTACDPNPCSGTGACCHDDTCTIETEADCTGLGGDYIGEDTTCDPNPCFDCDCGTEINSVTISAEISWFKDFGDGQTVTMTASLAPVTYIRGIDFVNLFSVNFLAAPAPLSVVCDPDCVDNGVTCIKDDITAGAGFLIVCQPGGGFDFGFGSNSSSSIICNDDSAPHVLGADQVVPCPATGHYDVIANYSDVGGTSGTTTWSVDIA